jgi:acyl-CoA hydrolase
MTTSDLDFSAPASTERLDRTVAALRERGHDVHLVDSAGDARATVVELLPTDRGIFTASSETLRLAGITAAIEESGVYNSVRKQAAEFDGDFVRQLKRGAAPDVTLGSVHAITEDGQLIAASATGSQLASYAAGAMRTILVVGAQKIVPDLDTALRRIREHCLPLESQRVREASGQDSFIGKILIVEREAIPNRTTVVLVCEPIGF